jgi:RHS repeat-associated protein
MSGDKIDILGNSYYFNNNTGGQHYSVPVEAIMNGILGSPAGKAAVKSSAGNSINRGSAFGDLVNAYLKHPDRNTDKAGNLPKAYINWILFDNNFKYVTGSFDRVGKPNEVKRHSLGNIPVTKNGYLYVYASNESPENVFFDNLQVTHTRGPILEETHYYPFGLTMAGISTRAAGSLQNKIKYNGKEEQRQEFSDGSGLEWLDFGARMYDNQIGRWMTPDPLASKYLNMSPYTTMDNNPINIVDPTGMSGEPVIDKKNKTVTITSNITFYGADGNAALATKAAAAIQSQWNAANGKTTIDGVEYSVKFVVSGTYDNSITAADISKNTDIKNNYIKIVASGIDVSYMDATSKTDPSGNTGVFLLSNINDANSTTETHEFGHGFGLDHPTDTDLRTPADFIGPVDGTPGIMYPRGTAVDADFTYDPTKGATVIDAKTGERTNTMNPTTRKVNQTDINNLGLNKLTYDPITGKAELGKLTNKYH